MSPALTRETDGRPVSPPTQSRLKRVLIANRGEIAVRVIRACRDRGIEAVVVYSEADADSLAVRMADRALEIGPASSAASYLNGDAILAAATAVDADGIHPGYGFLAENAAFARATEAAGLRFIGPGPRAIEQMGNKMEARRIAKEVGLAVIPGTLSAVKPADVHRLARELEFPLILKAAGGGGGRGMRLVEQPDDLDPVLQAATAEARTAFGDGAVYLERYLPDARHVEIQVVVDAYGNGIHLGERDCTVQRRYQKLIEEAPSPGLDTATRDAMGAAALDLCREVGYRGVGTVEFLLDRRTGDFYFIEMNTRLQVEHPVTEAVTGIDLVELQLTIAEGERLAVDQAAGRFQGHAIEFRINAEDAREGFRPAAGQITRWEVPLGPGVRVDTHCYAGYRVPPFYDSLLAKVIVAGATREQALARGRRALRELAIEGIETTLPFHHWALQHDDFVLSRTNTGWAERMWQGRAEE